MAPIRLSDRGRVWEKCAPSRARPPSGPRESRLVALRRRLVLSSDGSRTRGWPSCFPGAVSFKLSLSLVWTPANCRRGAYTPHLQGAPLSPGWPPGSPLRVHAPPSTQKRPVQVANETPVPPGVLQAAPPRAPSPAPAPPCAPSPPPLVTLHISPCGPLSCDNQPVPAQRAGSNVTCSGDTTFSKRPSTPGLFTYRSVAQSEMTLSVYCFPRVPCGPSLPPSPRELRKSRQAGESGFHTVNPAQPVAGARGTHQRVPEVLDNYMTHGL